MPKRVVRWLDQLKDKPFVLPVAAVVAAGAVLISELAYQGAVADLKRLKVQADIRQELYLLLRRVTDAETGQRGYMIARRPEYLEPYIDADREARAHKETLRALLRPTESEQERQTRRDLFASVDSKLSELAEGMRLLRAGNDSAAHELLLSGIGREHMQRIRETTNQLVAQQNVGMERTLREVDRTLWLNRLGIAAITLLGLTLMISYVRQAQRSRKLQTEQKQRLLEERARLESEVERRTADLTELGRHLQTAREDERARLARDLHDELGALLTAAKLDVARIRPQLLKTLPDLAPRVAHLTETLNSGIALKRRIIEDLRPSSLDNLGLLPSLEVLCQETSARLGVPIVLQAQPVRLSRSAKLTVYRMVQEALVNTAKYAQAAHVSVDLFDEGDWARVRITDDGKGFDTAAARIASHGLFGMRFRVEAERGTLDVRSSPGEGTTLEARLPQLAATEESSPITLVPHEPA